jgi:hypothetical protein
MPQQAPQDLPISGWQRWVNGADIFLEEGGVWLAAAVVCMFPFVTGPEYIMRNGIAGQGQRW